MKVGIIHYSCPPVVGGVETVMLGQARQFAAHGHPVRFIVGRGRVTESRIRTRVLPELSSDAPGPRSNRKMLLRTLRRLVRGLDVVLVHNVMTMHFNPGLTAAVWELAAETGPRMRWIFWTHDLTLENPDYPRPDTRLDPFRLLIQRHPTARYVAVSRLRRRQIARHARVPVTRIEVVPNGVDVQALLGLDAKVWSLFLHRRLAEQDLVLFWPTRILRRKNLETAIQLVAALKKLGESVLLLITGAADPHNPAATAYERTIRRLVIRKRLSKQVLLVKDMFRVGPIQLQGLYRICDAVIMTSRQEGFGLPVLEAGLHQKALICPRRPPFTELAGRDAIFLKEDFDPGRVARQILHRVRSQKTWVQFKRVLRTFSWQAVWRNHLSRIVR